MSRSKAPAKKQQKHGVDFKKIKRKIGRKLPPPKNGTNNPKSVASEKAELAVNKKGFTLKELLQQTSHYNSKVRKVVYLLQLLHKDDKICQIMSSFMAEIDYIMAGINLLQNNVTVAKVQGI